MFYCLFPSVVHFYLSTYQYTCLYIHSCLHSPSILFACTLASMAVEFSFTYCCYVVPVCLLESSVASIGPHAGLLACFLLILVGLFPYSYVCMSWRVCLLNCSFIFCSLVLIFLCCLFAYLFFGLFEYCPRGSVVRA